MILLWSTVKENWRSRGEPVSAQRLFVTAPLIACFYVSSRIFGPSQSRLEQAIATWRVAVPKDGTVSRVQKDSEESERKFALLKLVFVMLACKCVWQCLTNLQVRKQVQEGKLQGGFRQIQNQGDSLKAEGIFLILGGQEALALN